MSRRSPPPKVTAKNYGRPLWQEAPPRPAAQPANAVVNPDDRPIVARGFYDLTFFDSDNEYERYGVEVMQRDEARFQAFFQRYVGHLDSDFVSDGDFDREFTYERLLELDAQLMRRGGLTSNDLKRILVPVRGIEEDCVICMERSKRNDKMARLQCGHVFHCKCLQEWLGGSHTCPLCRADLRTNMTERDAGDDDSNPQPPRQPPRSPPPKPAARRPVDDGSNLW